MAVAAHQHFAGNGKPRRMNRVADAVPRTRNIDAGFLGSSSEIGVVVRSVRVDVQKVVIKVGNAQFGTPPRQADSLPGKVRHNCIDVVSQRLVHFNEDVLSGRHFSGNKMGPDDLSG